jgi:hypothetical protein
MNSEQRVVVTEVRKNAGACVTQHVCNSVETAVWNSVQAWINQVWRLNRTVWHAARDRARSDLVSRYWSQISKQVGDQMRQQ